MRNLGKIIQSITVMDNTEEPFDALCLQQDCKLFEIPLYLQYSEGGDFDPEISEPMDPISDNKVEVTKSEERSLNQNSHEQSVKASQSDLHNCPKHLIKFIIEGFNFPNTQILNGDTAGLMDEGARDSMKNLLGILELCAKGKIKSLSKRLLKIVFEEGSEHIQKLNLLQNPYIKKAFQGSNPSEMNKAKVILRAFTIEKLLKGKSEFVNRSRIVHKGVNQRYLQMFVQQLKNGKVKERVSKQDKEWILQLKNF